MSQMVVNEFERKIKSELKYIARTRGLSGYGSMEIKEIENLLSQNLEKVRVETKWGTDYQFSWRENGEELYFDARIQINPGRKDEPLVDRYGYERNDV
ncbi:hypothetical protein NST66_29015 [Priestia sp. FSL W8-0524]|uniref:hypothetical protein n=1 Tax=Priestia sp. FSL W8-0524 TaxID=2954625 RepID=UPI0030F8F25C